MTYKSLIIALYVTCVFVGHPQALGAEKVTFESSLVRDQLELNYDGNPLPFPPQHLVDMAIERLKPFSQRLGLMAPDGSLVEAGAIFRKFKDDTYFQIKMADQVPSTTIGFKVILALSPIVTEGLGIDGRYVERRSLTVERKTLTFTTELIYKDGEFDTDEQLSAEDLPEGVQPPDWDQYDEMQIRSVTQDTLDFEDSQLSVHRTKKYFRRLKGKRKWHLDLTSINSVENSRDLYYFFAYQPGPPKTFEEFEEIIASKKSRSETLTIDETAKLLSQRSKTRVSEKAAKMAEFSQPPLEGRPKSAPPKVRGKVISLDAHRKKSCGDSL